MLHRKTILKLKKLLCTCLCLFVFFVVFRFFYQTTDPFVGVTTQAIEKIDMDQMALATRVNLLGNLVELHNYVNQDPTFNVAKEST
jgi:hypothetical protein